MAFQIKRVKETKGKFDPNKHIKQVNINKHINKHLPTYKKENFH